MLNISQIEYYLPKNLISNQDLAELNPSWDINEIQKWTGVSSRYYASENETALDLAQIASENFFRNSKINREKIDGLIFCTQSSDYLSPPNSAILR